VNVYDTLRKGSVDACSIHASVCLFLRADSHRLQNMSVHNTDTYLLFVRRNSRSKRISYRLWDSGALGVTHNDQNSKCLVSTIWSN